MTTNIMALKHPHLFHRILILVSVLLGLTATAQPWTNRYNGPGNGDDLAYAVAVHDSNNVIVTGASTGSGSYYDYATIKYSSAGVPRWTNSYNGTANGNDEAQGVAVDSTDNVIVTGFSYSSGSSYDFVTVKYVCISPPVITDLKLTNGVFQILVENSFPLNAVVIEASTNLTDWSALFTNAMPTNVLFYTDLDARSLPWRFYRALQRP